MSQWIKTKSYRTTSQMLGTQRLLRKLTTDMGELPASGDPSSTPERQKARQTGLVCIAELSCRHQKCLQSKVEGRKLYGRPKAGNSMITCTLILNGRVNPGSGEVPAWHRGGAKPRTRKLWQ